MRVGLIWNAELPLNSISLSYSTYARGFSALGHEVMVYTLHNSGDGFSHPVRHFEASQAADPAYWQEERLDAAFLVTWLRMVPLLRALQAAGVPVINFCDTDGVIGYRTNPIETLRRMLLHQHGWLNRARCVKFWVQKLIFHAPREDAEMLDSLANSDLALLSNPETLRLVQRFVKKNHRSELALKMIVAPPPVKDGFLSGDLPVEKDPLLMAVGRWDDVVKGGRLLADAIECYLKFGGRANIIVVGSGGECLFSPLASRFPQVQYLGRQPSERIPELMRPARAILFSSHSEGGPNAANEMLAMGGTVVGVPLPAIIGLIQDGKYGRVAERRTATALAHAMMAEDLAWQEGQRDPATIARYWREFLRSEVMCDRILTALQTATTYQSSSQGGLSRE